jgi:hypothetical protein
LQKSEQNAKRQATAEVSAVKSEYAQKTARLEEREQSVSRKEKENWTREQHISEEVKTKAEAMSKAQRARQDKEHSKRMGELEGSYKAKVAGNEVFLFGCLLYGILCTVFTAIRSETFVSDFKGFFSAIWVFLQGFVGAVLELAQKASQLGDKIPQPIVAVIVHWLLLILVVLLICGGVGFLLAAGVFKLYGYYSEELADNISLSVALVTLAVEVFFAEWLRSWLPVNLLLFFLIVHALYIAIRAYVRSCKKNRGYYY